MKKTPHSDVSIEMPFQEPEFGQKWDEWLQYRKERRLPSYVPTGLKRTFNRIVALSNNDVQTAILIIDQSLANGWQGLFNLKNDFRGTISQRPASTVGREVKFDQP